MSKHYHVEAFDSEGRDVLPPRTLIVIEKQEAESLTETARKEVEKVVFSKVSYYVITELESV